MGFRTLVRLALLCALPVMAGATDSPASGDDVHKNWGFLDKYCSACHNATDWAGGIAFDTMEPDSVAGEAQTWEKVLRKLRGRMMPPPGEPQPDLPSLRAFASAMEVTLDHADAGARNPGSVGLHRLNRPEYANAIHELLALDVNPQALLPRDDQSDGLDNVADVLKVSPSFLDQYLTAARTISIQALGNPAARVQSKVYPGSQQAQQYMHLEGLPLGTRGGMLIEHDFPVDGDYLVTINGLVGAGYLWGVMDPNVLVVTLDGKRVFEAALGGPEDLDAVDLKQAEGVGAINKRFRDIRLHATAGMHRIGIAFRQKTAAVSNEVLHGFVPVEGMGQMVNGNSGGPRIANVEVKGPVAKSGMSASASRRKIFVCYPASAAEEAPCARRILGTLARQAFRRPVTDSDVAPAMRFYAQGQGQGGFEVGIQKGVMAILASPKFLFRTHTPPADVRPGESFAISNLDLASRLSFFLWSGPPDEELLRVAESGGLTDPVTRTAQVRRMLADPRAHALVTNFAFQWLNVRGLELVNPDTTLFPDYTDDLVPAFQRELELFIGEIFGEDKSVMELMTANYSYVNERLALHYGRHDVRGGQFRRITFEESYRRGLLGKGAFLMVTSYANRTTPVLRGVYVLEKFLGTPAPAPPPGVEAFPESQEGADQLTVRARLESHRKAKACGACHGIIDPIGLSMENFNAIGQWRDKDIDAGTPIDAAGKLMDGTPLKGPDDLREAIIARTPQFVGALTEKLMIFALGRSLQHYDQPTLRQIVRDAEKDNYRFSSLILGIVNSPAFLRDRVPQDTPAAITASTAQAK